MYSSVFRELKYNMGWEIEERIKFNGNEHRIIIHFKAYGDTDYVNESQKEVYSYFKQKQDSLLEEMEKILSEENENLGIYIPVMLLIKKNGKAALLFDDCKDNENGLAVAFYPRVYVTFQDAFL